MQNGKNSKLTGIVTVLSFLVLRMGLEPIFWRKISVYYSYFFELVYVLICFFIYRKQFKVWTKLATSHLMFLLVSLVSGFFIFKIALIIGVTIPFDFASTETVLLLLLLAPALEEIVFRFALWEGCFSILQNKWTVITLTSVLFSLGHFTAYWFVPEGFKSFVLYQALYTFFLGFGAGLSKDRFKSISMPVFIHFCFNLGFYLASASFL